MVGIVGHLQPMVLVPGSTGPHAVSPLNAGLFDVMGIARDSQNSKQA